MREIMFRGKRVDTGEWVYGYLFSFGNATLNYEETYILGDLDHRDTVYDIWKCAEKVIPETVGEFTGFTDRNGVAMFEGDLVRRMFGTVDTGDTFEIKFVNDRGGWYPFASGDGCGCCESDTYPPSDSGIVDRFIVLGNIHDNPEMLEAKHG